MAGQSGSGLFDRFCLCMEGFCMISIFVLTVALGATYVPVDSFATLAHYERAIVEMHRDAPVARLKCEGRKA
jgi:hypothetical protein